MFGLGFTELLFLLSVGVSAWCATRVTKKAGFPAAWGLVALVPLVNLMALWVFAFTDWPALPIRPSNPPRSADTGSA